MGLTRLKSTRRQRRQKVIRYSCHACGEEIESPRRYVRMIQLCPHCKVLNLVPWPADAMRPVSSHSPAQPAGRAAQGDVQKGPGRLGAMRAWWRQRMVVSPHKSGL